jgi:hypothetical protein
LRPVNSFTWRGPLLSALRWLQTIAQETMPDDLHRSH